jgi:hypothetical protein
MRTQRKYRVSLHKCDIVSTRATLTSETYMALLEIQKAKMETQLEERVEQDHHPNKEHKILLAYWSASTINELVKQSQ